MTGRMQLESAKRFWGYVEHSDTESCWPWIGGLDQDGYGMFQLRTKTTRRAHRLAFIEVHGEIPTGKLIDHTCHDPEVCIIPEECTHRRCCNPNHLNAVTHAGNINPLRARTGKGRHARGSNGQFVRMVET